MSRPTLLGIDGGGTTTIAWLADGEGTVVGCGQSGTSNLQIVGPDAAVDALNLAIRRAFENTGFEPNPVTVGCFGLAGFDRPQDRQRLEEWSRSFDWCDRLVAVNDADLVLAAGTPEGWGLAVVAGTGSIALGRKPDGQTVRAGGWGYAFGDEGSGYDVVCRALRHLARVADGREPSRDSDCLAVELCEALGIESAQGLVAAVYSLRRDRAQIAALAPVVVKAFDKGSAVAREILDNAANELFLALRAVARALGWKSSVAASHLPLAMAGGFLLGAKTVSDGLLAKLRRSGYAVHAATVPEPVRGAIVLGRKALRS